MNDAQLSFDDGDVVNMATGGVERCRMARSVSLKFKLGKVNCEALYILEIGS